MRSDDEEEHDFEEDEEDDDVSWSLTVVADRQAFRDATTGEG